MFDISSDLEELGRTPKAVVCAGPKAILDVPATLEFLETGACRSSPSARTSCPASTPARRRPRTRSVARTWTPRRLVSAHLDLGLGGAILVCVPVPAAEALPGDVARAAVERAIGEAEAAGIAGPELTPWLLARVATLTEGASIRANTALIVNDAGFAGALADRLSAM